MGDLPGIIGSLIVFGGSLIALSEIRIREVRRLREERWREWVMKDLPPVP